MITTRTRLRYLPAPLDPRQVGEDYGRVPALEDLNQGRCSFCTRPDVPISELVVAPRGKHLLAVCRTLQ